MMTTMTKKILIIESVSFILNPLCYPTMYIVNTSAMLLFSDILVMIICFGLMCRKMVAQWTVPTSLYKHWRLVVFVWHPDFSRLSRPPGSNSGLDIDKMSCV